MFRYLEYYTKKLILGLKNECAGLEELFRRDRKNPFKFFCFVFIYITAVLLSYRKNLFAPILKITFNYFETERGSSNRDKGFSSKVFH